MEKVIELGAQELPVTWFIDIGEKELLSCRCKEKGESRINPEAHWSICVEAPTVDRLCVMLKKAEEELRKNMAMRRRPAGRR